MKYFITSLLLLFITMSWAQKTEIKPEETEVWEPEPTIITPGEGTKPPSDAIVLLGNDTKAWEHADGSPVKWIMEDGILTVKPKSGGIQSKQSFGSIQLHIEWRTPPLDKSLKSQGRGNSGIFFQSKYELQVLDSYENRTYSNGQAGSIYKQHAPLVNASRPPHEWQSYDVVFTAPQFSEEGNLLRPAFITVFHNGVLIQNNVQLKGPTEYIGYPQYKKHGKLPLTLQDHNNTTSFRNIWVREL